MSEQISKYFTRKELACPCCGACEIDPLLIVRAVTLREFIKKPMVVTSAYRCPKHEKEIGGQGKSHEGFAMDFYVPGLTILQIYQAIEAVGAYMFAGIGVYPDTNVPVIHIDVWKERYSRWVCVGNKERVYFSLFAPGQAIKLS